eukprot:jgi/Phyca11/102891/e_gw1.7.859.1
MGIKASKSTEAQPQVPSNWSAADIPSQQNKIAIVTGANSGIGYEMALELARKGAHVILACRNEVRGLHAQADIQEALATASQAGSAKFMRVDMSDLSSVKSFCEEFHENYDRLDVLINNAGIAGSTYSKTVDGYELIFATNYLGHFALTARLLDLLKKSTDARVVSVSSFLHWYGSWVFDEDKIMVRSEKEHGQLGTYSVSKLCLLLFTIELDRRLKAAGITNITTAAAHPGYCDTKIMKKSAKNNSSCWLWWLFYKLAAYFPSQSSQMGALPTLYAAVGDDVESGDFFGPKHLGLYGYPVREIPSKLSDSKEAGKKLWAFSEGLANLSFDVNN